MSRHGKKLSKRFDLVNIYPLRNVFRLAISKPHEFLGEWVKLSRLRSRGPFLESPGNLTGPESYF